MKKLRKSLPRSLYMLTLAFLAFGHSSMAFTFEQHIWGDCGGITPSFMPGGSQMSGVVSGYRDGDEEWTTRAEHHGLILGDGSVAKITLSGLVVTPSSASLHVFVIASEKLAGVYPPIASKFENVASLHFMMSGGSSEFTVTAKNSYSDSLATSGMSRNYEISYGGSVHRFHANNEMFYVVLSTSGAGTETIGYTIESEVSGSSGSGGGTTSQPKSVTVSFFDSDGARICASASYQVGDAYGSLPVPTKTDHTFAGWHTVKVSQLNSSQVEDRTITANSIVDATITKLYAWWAYTPSQKVNVEFEPNGGSGCLEFWPYVVGDPYGWLPPPTKDGWVLDGWYSDSALTLKVDETTKAAAGVTVLYAKWAAAVTVAFNSNGGSSCSSQQYGIGSTYGSLPAPTKDRCTFAGWYSDSSLSKRVYESSTVSSSVTTLYAKWGTNSDGPILTILGGVSLISADLNGYTDVVLPTSVRWIDKYVFYNKIELRSISLPEGLCAIGQRAFMGCTNLQTLELPSTVTNILAGAFSGCSSIKSIKIPSRLTRNLSESDNGAFSRCTGLTDLTIEEGVKSLCDYMFYGCIALTNVVIPRSVTNLGCHTFDGCMSLKYAYVPSGLSTFNVFEDCSTELKIIYYTDSLIALETNGGEVDGLYVPCEYGAALGALPTPTKSGFVFVGWYSNAALTEEVTSRTMGSSALKKLYAKWSAEPVNDNFSSPTLIYGSSGWISGNNVGATMETSEPKPSAQVSSTGSIWYKWTAPSSGTATFDTIGTGFDTVLGVYTGTSVSSLTEINSDDDGGGNLTSKLSFEAVSGTTYRIAVYGFNGKTGSITLNWSLSASPTTIKVSFNSNGGSSCGDREYTVGGTYGSLPEPTKNNCSFAGWYSDSSLNTRVYTSTTVSSSVTTLYAKWEPTANSPIFTIEDGVLKSVDLNGCTEVTIPDGVTSIGVWAFANCGELTSVTIPDGVTSIGMEAFDSCTSLTSVTIPDSVTSIERRAFSSCNVSLFDTTTIPGVKLVDGWAVAHFSGLSGNLDLTGLRGIGDYVFVNCGLTSVTISNVPSIGELAFSGCSELTSVMIGNGVTNIGSSAFYYCSGLTNVTMANGVASIGAGAFRNCSGITSVTIPDSVTNIGTWAFEDCSGLTSVTIPDNVTRIGSSVFFNCSGLTSVTIGNGVTNIGSHMFYGCSGLTNVTIGSGVTCIEAMAFIDCSSIADLIIPNSVTDIGHNVFSGCSGLASVWIPTSVTSIGSYAFSRCSKLARVTMPKRFEGNLPEGIFDGCPSDLVVTYSDIAGCMVEFAANGGNVSRTSCMVSAGEAIGELPVPTRSGQKFLGWFTLASGGVRVTAETIVEKDITLYAHWVAAWTVKFNANGGTVAESSRMVQKGKAVGTLPKPTRSGYTFKGWYTKKSGGTKVSTKTKVKKNVTYYARWTAKKYAVTLKKTGKGTVSGGGKKAYKSKITLKAKASKGYVFRGWYDANGNLVSSKATWKTKVPLGGATYTAKFEKKTAAKSVTVTSRSTGGAVPRTSKGATVGTPSLRKGTLAGGNGTFTFVVDGNGAFLAVESKDGNVAAECEVISEADGEIVVVTADGAVFRLVPVDG